MDDADGIKDEFYRELYLWHKNPIEQRLFQSVSIMERTRESGGGSKKRIVAGSARSSLLIMNDDLEEEMEIDPFADCVDSSESSSMTNNRRKSNVGRRRSSLIKIPQMSEAEQMRIAEMYKTVIQMSSENVSC